MSNNLPMNLLKSSFSWSRFDKCFKKEVFYFLLVKKILAIGNDERLTKEEKLKKITKVLVPFGLNIALTTAGGMVPGFPLLGSTIGNLIAGLLGVSITDEWTSKTSAYLYFVTHCFLHLQMFFDFYFIINLSFRWFVMLIVAFQENHVLIKCVTYLKKVLQRKHFLKMFKLWQTSTGKQLHVYY